MVCFPSQFSVASNRRFCFYKHIFSQSSFLDMAIELGLSKSCIFKADISEVFAVFAALFSYPVAFFPYLRKWEYCDNLNKLEISCFIIEHYTCIIKSSC